MWNRLLTGLRVGAALFLIAILAGATLVDPAPATRGEVLITLLLSLALGTWLRQTLTTAWARPRLQRAEAAWAEGTPPGTVLAKLPARIRVSGELGYRIELLRGQCLWAEGRKDLAWVAFLRAQLLRTPLLWRPLVARCFRAVPGHPSDRRIAWGGWLIRRVPRMARLRHLHGILLLRQTSEAALSAAWQRFGEALPLAADDPMLLEDLLLASLQHGREPLAERALDLLQHRFGDPRLPWDRALPAFHRLQQGRWQEALALVAPLAPDQRDQPMPWLVEITARRNLGDREGAWQAVEAGLARLPRAFRLWLERYQTALERREEGIALQSLERAWDLIPEGPEGDVLRQEWRLRRAEFAFWWEDDPDTAWDMLQQLPAAWRNSHHPPLALQVQVARGEYEAAYRDVAALLAAQPADLDLLFLQAECLAGMETWEALLPFLDGLEEKARARPGFWHLRGLALANLGEALPARLALERAARMDPDDLRCLLDAGHGCAELGEWERAEQYWREALLVDGQSEEALIHLAEARRELQDPEGSRRYLRECLLHHPHSADAQLRLAELEAN
jgi:tetratricopeptide (TPR) repeat protein